MKGNIKTFKKEIKSLSRKFDKLNIDTISSEQKDKMLNGSEEEMKQTIKDLFNPNI
tara:strand:- start:949 stop:1116 length:168 start_codon:yes stop_codon:yes gene_type:complete